MARKEFERRAIALNKRLKEPGKTLSAKIAARVFPAGPIYRTWRKRSVHYCSECGCEIEWTGQKECPQCHTKWTAKPEAYERRSTDYHMIMEAKGDLQLCRIYRVDRFTGFGKKVINGVYEVERIMYSESGERCVFAKSVCMMSCYYDAFSLWSDLELRREPSNQSYNAEMRYNLSVGSYHIKSLTRQWRYKRVDDLMREYENDTSVLRVIAYPWGETARKTQPTLFDHLVMRTKLIPNGLEHTINICNRNHYTISDCSLWLDHMVLLKHFKLDTHNAHYVCPSDLQTVHAFLVARRRKEIEREIAERRRREQERRIKQHKEAVAAYTERWGKALMLSLSGDNLRVEPLHSVEEFAEEGKAMHHCVFSMGYYKSETSLIFSAKDGEGKRLATIEYDTRRGDIVQCRAACNAIPQRDQEIRSLIISNKKTIALALKPALKAAA